MQNDQLTPLPKRRSRLLVALSLYIGLLLVLGGVYLAHRHQSASGKATALPQTIAARASFPVLYPSPLPDGYTLVPSSVSYSQGILFFTIRSGTRAITLSEQATPEKLRTSSVHGDEAVSGVTDGSAAVSFDGSRTTATVLSKHGTMVVLNTESGVPADTVKEVVRSLRAVPN